MKTIYLGTGYTDPSGKEPYWTYPRDVLCPKYGFRPFWIVYADAYLDKESFGDWDLCGLLREVNSVPTNATVLINLESDYWRTWELQTGQPRHDVIRRLVRLTDLIKFMRPDITLGYFDLIGGGRCGDLPTYHKLLTALEPLAKVVDLICPEMYVNKLDFDLSQTLWLHRTTLKACKEHFDKPLAPFYWAQWKDISIAQGKKDRYTDEEMDEARIPGNTWAAIIEPLPTRGVNQFVLWGQYARPWGGDWVQETVEWMI